MTTFATLKSRIADDLRRADLDAQIASAVLDAVKRWEGERFWFNEGRFRIDTVSGTEEYTLPDDLLTTAGAAIATGEDLLDIDDVVILDNNHTYRLEQRTDSYLNDVQAPSTQYTGTPNYYTVYANKMRFGPIPDAVYQITVSGIKRLEPLSDDGDTNAWTTEAEALIRHQALAEMYRTVLRDADGFQIALGGVQDAAHLLQRKSSGKVAVGRIRPWGHV